MHFLITAQSHAVLAQPELAHTVAQRIGQPLRRAGTLASLALLACSHVLEQERGGRPATPASVPTALLWHSRQGPQQETESLLNTQREENGLLLPLQFLASQPAVLGAVLKPWVPGLEQLLFLPCTAQPMEQPWLQSLQQASIWLAEGRYQRVICAELERSGGSCRYAALSVVSDSASWSNGPVEARGNWEHGQAMWHDAWRADTHASQAAASLDESEGVFWRLLHSPLAGQACLQAPWGRLHLERPMAHAAPVVGESALQMNQEPAFRSGGAA